jgi:serine/threonine protein kinase
LQELLNNGVFAVKELKQLGSTQEVVEHWEREVKALRMMNELQQDNIVRFITAFRRVKRQTDEHYVVFEWADGGNLQDLWDKTPFPILTGPLIKLVVEQLLGLATALSAAHNLEGSGTLGASYRHGDLKPENILVFKDGGPIGKLKIGDWGEAKYQGRITAIRANPTEARYGNRRYEAPEVKTGVRATFLGQSKERRSRLGDVWAMGCITLEFIVWLLYGKKGLDQFNHDVSGDTFYTTFTENGEQVAKVHVNAIAWMERMASEPVCKVGETALGDLLQLVMNDLLVVRLPQQLGSELPLDRSRVDSVVEIDQGQASGSLEVLTTDVDGLSIFEEDIERAGPSITVTPAAPIVQTEDSRMPLQRRLEAEGPKRCYASIFRDMMYHIVSEDDIEGYWDVPEIRLEAPTDVATVDDVKSANRAAPFSDVSSRVSYCPFKETLSVSRSDINIGRLRIS